MNIGEKKFAAQSRELDAKQPKVPVTERALAQKKDERTCGSQTVIGPTAAELYP
jgi:hypothetical protein